VQVAELMALQRSNILDVDDNTYPIILRYRDFSLERHETYPHSSEQCVAYQSNVAMYEYSEQCNRTKAML
jgi:hypothetical protein